MNAVPPKMSLFGPQGTAQALLGSLRLPARRDWQFRIGLGCAALIHLLIIVGMLVDKGEGRRMGEPDQAPDGVSVVIMDAADLKSRTTVPLEAPAAPPTPPPTPPQAQPQPQQQPQQQPPTLTPPQREAQPTPPQPDPAESAEAAPSAQPAPPQPKQPQPQPQPTNPDAPGEPPPPPQQRPPRPTKQAAARPANPAPSAPPSLNLNLNVDPSPAFMSRGGSFAPTRPPGITRSGENDEFGRGVIRALQRTVPQLVNTVGRVTVRININTKGNLASVEVLRPSGVGNIDQSVVFAVKQASFPIPPDNLTDIDRTFFVTYIFTVY